MKHPFVSRRALALSCLGFLAFPWACSEKKPRGELMLAISADMSIPKNMNQVTVEVLDDKGEKTLATYPLRPQDLGQPMPGSLAIVPPDGGGERVRIRLRAEHDDARGGDPTVRVVREAVVKIPTGRVAMLTMPLRWLCDGKVKQDTDGSYISDCGHDETCAAGICIPAVVDSDKLPAYDPKLIFGGGDENGKGGVCMDVVQCFSQGFDVQPDATCTVPLPPGADEASLNVAMVTGNGGDGICPDSSSGSTAGSGGSIVAGGVDAGAKAPNIGIGGSTGGSIPNTGTAGTTTGTGGGTSSGTPSIAPQSTTPTGTDGTPTSGGSSGSSSSLPAGPATCYVPLDKDPTEGWHVVGNRVQLPAAVCQRLSNHTVQGVRVSTACKSKDLTVPICGAWSNVGSESAVGGGPTGSGGGGNVSGTDGGVLQGGAPNPGAGGGTTCAANGSIATKVGSGTIFLVLDESSAMMVDPSWSSAVANGVMAFATSPAASGVSMALEIAGQTCGPALLQVPPTPLPQGASMIGQTLTGMKPTDINNLDYGGALQSVYSTTGRTSGSAVVLVTAGAPGACPQTTDPVVAAQTAAAAGVPTYVLQFPGSTDTTVGAIATAGGKPLTTYDSVMGSAQITQLLQQVGTSFGAGCSYRWDPTTTVVEYHAGGTTTTLTRVSGASACLDGTSGYYVSPDGTTFSLCAPLCSQAATDPTAQVAMMGGCGGSIGTGGGINVGGGPGAGGTTGTTGGCATNADCPGACCVIGPQVCGVYIQGLCSLSGGIGGAAGSGGFGGTTGASTCAGVGQGGSGPTQADCDLCVSAATTTCQTCTCQNCLLPEYQCSQDPGCSNIAACIQSTGCSSPATCYQPTTCASVIDANGGPSGASANLAMSYGNCLRNICGSACGLCQQGLTSCSGKCTNLMSDALNCGTCGNVCSAGLVCTSGLCGP